MALHFSRDEFARRQTRAREALAARGLDALLIFRQESMYYLTGYDTMGFSQFQCLCFGTDGALTLVTRSADLRQAAATSVIEDVRVWVDRADANPAGDVREVLAEHGLAGKRLGIELDAYALSARRGKMVEAALEGFCTLEDATDVVNELRLVKSPAELDHVRRAAELADAALEAAHATAGPGVFEGEVFAAMHTAIFRGGGDYPASRFIIGSGSDALLVRNFAGQSTIAANDQLQLEFGAAYRHYHACLMRTLLVGEAKPRQADMHEACVEALAAAEAALKPGNRVGDVFDAHARTFDEAGYGEHRLNACGYSLGALYPPSWMDWPMFYTGNPVVIEPDMVFFMHMVLLDSDRGLAMAAGETARVTVTGCEPLSAMPLDLVIK